MTSSPTSPVDLKISGDTLALAPEVREGIKTQADQLNRRYPGAAIRLGVEILETFDPATGHRIRCELSAEIRGRRTLLVRESQKEASGAVRAAFRTARRQLARPTVRNRNSNPGSSASLRPLIGGYQGTEIAASTSRSG